MNHPMVKIAISAASALAAGKAARELSGVGTDDLLGWAGLERSRSRFWENVGLVGVGACVGAVGALLFAPMSGREARRKLAEEAERFGEQARDQLREARERVIEEARTAVALANESEASRAIPSSHN